MSEDLSGAAAAIEALAVAQLVAYNAWDLDAFCRCYHDDVRVLDAEGAEQVRGQAAFRARYAEMFERGGFGGEIDGRLVHGEHCVERERWWRDPADGGERLQGTVLVRYSLRDGRIGTVAFLR